MNASKENGNKALMNLRSQEVYMNGYAFQFITEFLEAAIKKLPTEEAFNRAKLRKKTAKSK